MSYYLLKFKKNWADEFDCEGFKIINETEFDFLNEMFNSEFGNEYVDWNFGSNEGWEGEFTFNRLWNGLLKKERISYPEAETIQKHLLSIAKMSGTQYMDSYGIFPEFSELFEIYEDDRIEEYYSKYDNGEFVL